jgi:hypothetical protein
MASWNRIAVLMRGLDGLRRAPAVEGGFGAPFAF